MNSNYHSTMKYLFLPLHLLKTPEIWLLWLADLVCLWATRKTTLLW